MRERMTYKVKEAAEILGISVSSVWRLIAAERLRAFAPSGKPGGMLLITHEALQDFIGENPDAPGKGRDSVRDAQRRMGLLP